MIEFAEKVEAGIYGQEGGRSFRVRLVVTAGCLSTEDYPGTYLGREDWRVT